MGLVTGANLLVFRGFVGCITRGLARTEKDHYHGKKQEYNKFVISFIRNHYAQKLSRKDTLFKDCLGFSGHFYLQTTVFQYIVETHGHASLQHNNP